MTSPNVGKVELTAALNMGDIRDQLRRELTKDLHDELLGPNGVLTGVDDELKDINAEIKKVNAKSFQELAKEARIVRDEAGKVTKAVNAETQARKMLNRAKEDERKKTEALIAASKKEQDQIKATGKVSDETRRKRIDAENAVLLAIENREQREQQVDDAKLRRLAEEKSERESVHDMILGHQKDEIAGWNEVADMVRSATNERIREAQRASEAEYKVGKKYNDDWTKWEKERTRIFKSESDKRAAEERKKQQDADRARRRKEQESFINEATQLGRQVGAIGNLAGPVAIGGAAVLLADLASAASAASQSIGLVPAGFAAIEAASVTLKIGLLGIPEAITAIFDPNADPEKVAEALGLLSGNAQAFMLSLKDAVPLWEELKRNTQDALFGGDLTEELRTTIKQFFPMIEQLTTGIAGAFNQMASGFLKGLQNPETMNALQEFVNNVVSAFNTLSPAVQPITEALGILLGEGSDFLPEIADAIKTAAIEFSNFIKQASESGQLHEFIQGGIDAMSVLVGWVKLAVEEWFKLAPVGEDILPEIDRLVRAIIEVLPDLIQLLSEIGGNFEMITGLLQVFDTQMAGINKMLGVTNEQAGDLNNTMSGWLNPLNMVMNTIKAIVSLLSALPFVGDSINQAAIDAGLDVAPSGGNIKDAAQAKLDAARRRAGLGGGLNIPGLGNNTIAPPVGMNNQQLLDIPGIVRRRDGSITYVKPPSSPDHQQPENLTDKFNKANAPSDSDLKKQIEDSIHPVEIDPWAQPGSPNVQGDGSLSVNVTNMPTGGIPTGGLGGLPGMGGVPPINPTGPYTGPTDAGSIAQLIAGMAAARGYTAEQQKKLVAYSLGESSLDPTRSGGQQGDDEVIGLFQEKAAFSGGLTREQRMDPVANINAYLNQLEKHRDKPFDTVDTGALAATSVGGPLSSAGLQNWSELQSRAANLLGPMAQAGNPSTPGGIPVQISGAGLPDAHGAKPQVQYLTALANAMGLEIISGKNDHVDDGLNHPKGLAGDFAIPGSGGNTPEQARFAQFLHDNFGDLLNELIYSDPNAPNVGISMGKPHQFDPGLLSQHENHIHASVSDQNAAAFVQRLMSLGGVGGDTVPKSLKDNMYAANGSLVTDPSTGEQGYFQIDQQALDNAADAVDDAAHNLSLAVEKYQEGVEEQKQNLISQDELTERQHKMQEAQEKLDKEKKDYDETARGKFKEQKAADYSKLPFGDPRRILAGAISGAGGNPDDVAALVPMLLGNAAASAAGPLGNAAGTATTDALTAIGPTFGPNQPGVLRMGTPTAMTTDDAKMVQERNPLAIANLAGFDVPDYTRAGGGPSAQGATPTGQAPTDAMGRIYSDTAALIDRTFTNLDAAEKARFDQTMAVLNQIKDRLAEDAIGPAVESGTSGALAGIPKDVTSQIGTEMGNAAGPIIGQAVAAAMPEGDSSSGAGMVNTGFNAVAGGGGAALGGLLPGGFVSGFGMAGGEYMGVPEGVGIGNPLGALYDEGGLWPSGTFGTNLSGADERVLSPMETRLFDSGQLGGWNLQPEQQHFATTSGVNVNDTVGAEFFGVSQIPIIGAIVNLLIRVLLKVLGVEIEARDTMYEMSKQFRDFRGEFAAFDASGRIMNDTSGLVDRSSTSEETAAAERIRILKIVLEALIKYIIEKLIVPIGKAVANSLISAGAGAAGGGIGGAFPGGGIVGGAVSSMISSAGSAGVDIAAEIFTDFSLAASSVALQALAEGFMSYFPGLATGIFSGAGMEQLFAGPLSALLGGLLAAPLSLFGALGTVAGPGLSFDDGGLATGMGWMPKATIAPERVLSPSNTRTFDALPSRLDALINVLRNQRRSQVNATIHAPGGDPNKIRDGLLKLM